MKRASKKQLYADVQFLTSILPPRNYRNLNSLESVCRYLEAEFTNVGAVSRRQSWMVDDREYHNIITSYNEDCKQRLIVGAHYDVAGDQPGADDNASAVAGLIETVRLVFTNKPVLPYRIDFVAFCLEEPPFFAGPHMGSFIHAKSLSEANAEVMGMICYEMIGYFSDEPGSQPYPTPELAKFYPDAANFIIVVGIDRYADFNNKVYRLMCRNAAIDVQKISFPASHTHAGLAGLSDQRSYWQFDYPALMINDTSFIRNPHYHLPSDTIDTLDFDKMTAVVDCAYNAITNMHQ